MGCKKLGCRMRVTISIDADVLKFIMEETKSSTRAEAIRRALDDFVRRSKIEKLIALRGKVKFDVDWKTLRKGWTRKFPRFTFKTDRRSK